MKTIEVNISLNPVDDGVIITESEQEENTQGALIISTNGNERIASPDEVLEVLQRLSGALAMGRYVVFYNEDRLIGSGPDKCLIGSVMIVKRHGGSYYLLESGEFKDAERAFLARLITINFGGQKYTALEV